MSYVLDRDGIASCPDDPSRVAPPDERPELDKSKLAELAAEYDHEVYMVIDGYRSTARVAGQEYDVAELFELIFMVENPETMRLLMAYDRATKERLIRDWCCEMATKYLKGS